MSTTENTKMPERRQDSRDTTAVIREAITIKDIARLAGVSMGTVDRVLHNRGRVSTETSERVHRIVRETRYTPNLGARRLSRSKTWTIGAVFPRSDQDGGFWIDAGAGLQRAAEDFGGFGLRSRSFPFDRTRGSDLGRAIHEAASSGVDGILLAPVIPEAALEALSKLENKLPLVLFDTPLPDAHALCFVGQDAFSAGRIGARLLSLGVSDPSRIACVVVKPSDYHIVQRVEGFTSFFAGGSAPAIFDLDIDLCDRSIESLVQQIGDCLPAIDGVYVSNAAVGDVATVLSRRGNRPLIVGHDLTASSLASLQSGSIDFLITQHPALQTWEAMRLFWRYFAADFGPPKDQYLPIDVVGQENWAYYREI